METGKYTYQMRKGECPRSLVRLRGGVLTMAKAQREKSPPELADPFAENSNRD